MKYIDADLLRAEIERLYYNEAEKDESILAANAYKNALDAVEKFLDTIPEQEHPIYQLNQILLDWVREAKTDKEQEARFEAYKRFFELYDEYMMQEQEQPMDIPSAGSGATSTTPPKFKLEVKKQPVTNCNELVSEINKKLGHDDWLEVVFDRKTLIEFAGHFYALGLNARKEE